MHRARLFTGAASPLGPDVTDDGVRWHLLPSNLSRRLFLPPSPPAFGFSIFSSFHLHTGSFVFWFLLLRTLFPEADLLFSPRRRSARASRPSSLLLALLLVTPLFFHRLVFTCTFPAL